MNACDSYFYAKDVVGGRYPDGEAKIAQSPYYACAYAEFVLRDRFPLGEAAIARNAQCAYYYAVDVLKGRFRKGEPAILNSVFFWLYDEHFGITEKLNWQKVGF